MPEPRVLIIVPAYNEARNLAGVLDELAREAPSCDVLVVDDCSKDDTRRLCTERGVPVVTTIFNLGIGGAVQTGYKYAAAHGYDVAVQVDGDGQHPADQLPSLLKPLLGGEADMIIGSRYLVPMGYELQYPRFIGTLLFSKLTSLILGRRITDVTSGFRAADRKTLLFLASEYPEDFPDVETVLLLGLSGFRLAEVPLRMRRRASGRSSINFTKSVIYIFKTLMSVLAVLMRKRLPAAWREAK